MNPGRPPSSGLFRPGANARGVAGALLPLLFFLLLLHGCTLSRQPNETVAIRDLARSTAAHAGRWVLLHGTAAGPMTGRGDDGQPLCSYMLVDESGLRVRVLARGLPREGASYRVVGRVGHEPANALRPLVLETRRNRPLRDPLLALGLLVAVLGSVPPVLAGLRRRMVRPGPTAAGPSYTAPTIRPGVKYILALEVVAGEGTGRCLTFDAPRILVGRPGLRHNDLSLEDSTVSRAQAVILRDDRLGGYKVRNEGRTNPLKVNGRPSDAVSLRHGDLLTVGRTTLRVAYREPAPGSGPGGPAALLLAAMLAASPAWAGEREVALDALDVRRLPEVTCRFRVVDDAGAVRCGLGPADLRVLTDGREPKEARVRFQMSGGAVPPPLVLVVQATSEERGRGLFLLKSAVAGFLDRWPEGGEVALVSHGGDVRVDQAFTTDRRLLIDRLEAVPLGRAEGRGYYSALERAAALFGERGPGAGPVIYFCRPDPFGREDMRPESPRGLRGHPEVPIYPVLHPERDGDRTAAYLGRLARKLTAGFTGHYTLTYGSPGGEDKRVHSLRIEWLSPGRPVAAAQVRYLAHSGSGLEPDLLLADEARRSLARRLIGSLIGLLAGALTLRWAGGAVRGNATRGWAVTAGRLHVLCAGAVAGLLASLLLGLLK